jgi:hypothetical protein
MNFRGMLIVSFLTPQLTLAMSFWKSSGSVISLLGPCLTLLCIFRPVDALYGVCTYTCTEEVVDHFEIELGYELDGLRNFWFFPAYLMVRNDDEFRCALFPGYFLLARLSGYDCFDQNVG